MTDKVYTVSELNTEGINVSGKEPDGNSWIQIENNNVKSGCLQFDEYKVDITNGNIGSGTKGECVMSFNPTSLIVTSGDGLYESATEPGRLIYRGQDPNNRIFLKEDGTNNTLYRIVSFEADGTIKVVRDDKLDYIAWDKANTRNSTDTYCTNPLFGCNVWGNGSNTLYNGSPLGDDFHYVYYSSSTATTMTNGTSGTVTSDSTLNTYLNSTWLPLSLSNYIDNHSWNVGGVYHTSDDKGIAKEKEEERQLRWTGKVGLLNITEFVEASTNSSCTSMRSNYASSSGSPCKTDNWTIYNRTFHQWSLSPNSFNWASVWYVHSAGYFECYINSASTSMEVRPAFYLKSGLSLSGTGAEGSEYTID